MPMPNAQALLALPHDQMVEVIRRWTRKNMANLGSLMERQRGRGRTKPVKSLTGLAAVGALSLPMKLCGFGISPHGGIACSYQANGPPRLRYPIQSVALPSTAKRARHLWQFCNISGYWAY